MTIIRVKKDKGYFVASNKPFNDKSLSWEARGMLGYLLSKPDDWIVRNVDLYRQGPAGKNKVKRILTQLKNAGYLVRTRIRQPDGTFEWESTLYETPPTIAPKTIDGSSVDGKQGHILSTEFNENEGKNGKADADALNPTAEKQPVGDDNHATTSADRLYFELVGQPIPKEERDDILDLIGEEPDESWLRDCHRLACASGVYRRPIVWLELYAYRHLDDVQCAVLKIPHQYDFSGDWKEHPKILEYYDITGRYPKRECAGMVIHTMESRPGENWNMRYENWTDRDDYNPFNDVGWLYERNPNYLCYVGMPE